MKRFVCGLLALALLTMAAVPTFAVDTKGEKPVRVGDVQSTEMPEAVKEIQQRALQIPADQRMQFIRNEMVRLSVEKNIQVDEQTAAEKEKRALDIKLDEQKGAMLADIRQGIGNVTLGAPVDPDDFEPDDSHNQGEKILKDTWNTKHTIAPAGDVDFFWFYGQTGDAVEIITKTANPYWPSDGLLNGPAEGDLDPYLTIYLPDRSVLAANDDAGAGWDAFLSVFLPQDGIYYISVEASPDNPSIGAYELGLAFLKTDAAEVDNDMASASLISNGQTIPDRTIFPLGDVDYYKFNVPVDYVSIQAAIVNTPAALNVFHNFLDTWPESYMHNLDPKIELYDANGTLMPHPTGDDRFEPYDPDLGYLDAELIYPYLMAGDYYLVVRHDGTFNGIPLPATGVGAYKMTLNLAFPDPFEYDDEPAFANPISAGDVIKGHTITPQDWDVFVFEGKAGQFVEITVSTVNPCGVLDPILLLWDANWEEGTLIQPSWDQGIGLDAYILWGPLTYTGKYYIDVGPDMHIGYHQADVMGSYTISLETHSFSGGVPWNPANALPIDFNVKLKNQILARIGTYLPTNQFGRFETNMPVWYKFDGLAGEQIGAKVETPFQYRGICQLWEGDDTDDLNPELYLVKLDECGTPVVLAYNENLDPNNLFDDAGFQSVLPEDGTYYLVVQSDLIGPIVDPTPPGYPPLVQHTYGRFSIEVVRIPRVVDFDSDINLGHPPLKVNFFEHCIVKDDKVVEKIVWDAMYDKKAMMYGPEPYFCYWLQGVQGKHDVLKTGSNLAGSVSELKEKFVVVYEPNGYAPMELVQGVGDFVKEPWAAAVDADDYCWNGVATVKVTDAGEQPWALFKFVDGKTKKVNKLRIKTDAGMGNVGRWAKHVEILAENGGNFVSIAMVDFAGGDWHEVTLEPAVETAQLKVVVLDDPVEYPGWRQISEFEAYEDIVIPCPELSMLSVTSPHLANGVDAAQLTLKLVDVNGVPITTYDEADITFHLWDCEQVMFGALDMSEAANGIYKTTLTMASPGAYKVVAVAHGAVIKNDIVGDNETIATIAFFGYAGQKGELMFVEGSPTSKGEGWDNAIDGDRVGWDGTVTTKGAPPYAIFKFTNNVKMPINKVALVTDNGFEDDAYEGRQVRHFEILVSDDMTNWTSAYVGRRSTGEYVRYQFPVVFGKYVKLLIHGQDNTWAQLVEFEVLFDSKVGFQTEEVQVAAVPQEYALESNYPNPFNPTTTIHFQLPQDGFVTLSVYNMVGQKVATLLNGQVSAGYHSVTWEAGEYPTGIYLYRIEAGEFKQTKRMVLLK